jgi:hypothetical protein
MQNERDGSSLTSKEGGNQWLACDGWSASEVPPYSREVASLLDVGERV